MENFDALQARQFYTGVGLSPIPIPKNQKEPALEGWDTLPEDELWRRVRPNSNIGLRFGQGPHRAIDCDNRKQPETFANISNRLTGLGLTPPVVKTASGIGRHIHLLCPDIPAHITKRNIAPELGAGEFFGHWGQVIAPWSIVNGNSYQLISGNWNSIPEVLWRDLAWLIPQPATPPLAQIENLPVPIIWRRLSPRLEFLFDALSTAPKGASIGKYQSRSEAECALVASLALCGWTLEQIQIEFENRLPGHYAKYKPNHRPDYLRRTWQYTLATISKHKHRQQIQDFYIRAALADWPGRTGGTDRRVLLALIAECWLTGEWQAHAGVRQLAEGATVQPVTISRSLKRLEKAGHVERLGGWTSEHAATWGILMHTKRYSRNRGGKGSGIAPNSTTVSTVAGSVHAGTPELWSFGGLGPSCMMVFTHLDELEPREIKELAELSGKHRNTVSKALKKLERHRLALRNVVLGDGWIRGTADLEKVSAEWECAQRATHRRVRHKWDRDKFAEWKAGRESYPKAPSKPPELTPAQKRRKYQPEVDATHRRLGTVSRKMTELERRVWEMEG